MNIGIIIQARLGSTRMPKKVIKPFYKEESILSIQIANIKTHFPTLKVILATSTNPENDLLVEMAEELDIDIYRGSENDVLQRFIDASDFFQFDRVVRVCSDNPLLDVKSVSELLSSDADYSAYSLSDGTPTIKTHYGFWPEVVSVEALKQAANSTNEPFFHEHVTNYIYTNPENFSIQLKQIPTEIEREKSIRTTIDTQGDFDNISKLYASIKNTELELNPKAIAAYLVQYPTYLEEMQKQIELNSK